MQLAAQRTANPPAHAGGSDKRPARTKKDARAATIAAIHITWAKIAKGMKADKDELRQARLDFMSAVLKRDVTTSRGLSQAKLGRVLDAMRELETAPLLPGAALTVDRGPQTEGANGRPSSVGGQVVHLATGAQTATIKRLFAHLGWSIDAIEGFVLKRFKVKSHQMLTPEKANALTMVLFTIAASRAIKLRTNVAKVSRQMIRAEIPALKRRLGIDQQRSEPPALAGGPNEKAGRDACAPSDEDEDNYEDEFE